MAPDTAPKDPLQVPEVIVPVVVILDDPASGDAPTELYDIVLAAEPLKVVPDALPVPPLLNVTALVTDAALPSILVIPVNAKLALALFNVTAVVPI